MMTDPRKKVLDVTISDSDKMACVTWEETDAHREINKRGSVVIAAYVTAQARLRLYDEMERLDKRVLYFDTDSLIYVQRKNDPYRPKLGSSLGCFTNEIVEEYGTGAYINEFVSGGPKNYGYKVYVPQTGETHVKCKVRGLTLNHRASEIVNFETMVRMVKEGYADGQITHVEPVSVLYPYQIMRKGVFKTELVSKPLSKIYTPVYNKRRLIKDHKTLPYGFRGPF